MIDVHVVEDPAAEVADLLLDIACAGGQIALSGGSTPRRAYELASRSDADLSAATLWLGDERLVPLDDERSNLRMVRAVADREPARGAAPAADAGRHDARPRRRGGGLRGAAARDDRPAPAARPRADGPRARRPHRVAVPGQAGGDGDAALRGRRAGAGHGAVRAARDAHAAAVQHRARGRLPRLRRRQGTRRGAGVRHAARRDACRPRSCARAPASCCSCSTRRPPRSCDR